MDFRCYFFEIQIFWLTNIIGYSILIDKKPVYVKTSYINIEKGRTNKIIHLLSNNLILKPIPVLLS